MTDDELEIMMYRVTGVRDEEHRKRLEGAFKRVCKGKRYREAMRRTSNNKLNPNKNVCALAVARLLCCDQQTRYLHNWGDLQRAIRSLWSMRSVKSYVKATPDSTVGSLRKAMHEYATKEQHLIAYVIRVEGHVLMIDRNGKTLVDTAPRKRDRRKVLDITGIYLPDNMTKLEALTRASAAKVEETTA